MISKEGCIKITNADGTSISLESNSRSTCLSPEMQEMLEKTHKWHKFCLEEELIREKRKEIYKDIISFPLTIGRRPQVIVGKPLSGSGSGGVAQHISSSQPNLVMKSNGLNNKVSSEDDLSTEYQISKNMNALDLKSASSTSLTSSSTNIYQNYPSHESLRMKKLASFDSQTTQSPSPLNLPSNASYAQSYTIQQAESNQNIMDANQYYVRNQYCMPANNLVGANQQIHYQQLQQQVKLNRQLSNC